MRWLAASIVFLTSALAGKAALALSEPWQMSLQDAASPIMERIQGFHTLLMWIITLITIFVLALLVYVCYRFHEKRNPTPSKRSHHAMLEVVWTAVPVLILVIVAIPSFKLLYYSDVVPQTEMTVKAIGRQWYWSYQYPDHDNIEFDAYMIPEEDLQEGQLRLAGDGQSVGPSGEYQHPRSGYRFRCDPCLGNAGSWDQDRRRSRTPQRGLDPRQ